MRYIIAPLDLTTEEMEIYRLLYNKVNFDTYEVKYTTDQLVADSNKKLELTFKKVYKILKDFEENDFICKVKRGSKGNPTVYKINQIREIKSKTKENCKGIESKLKESNKEIKNEQFQQFSDFKESNKEIKRESKESCKEIKGKIKGNPINDKDKDKEIYRLVIEKLNELAGTNFRINTKKTIDLIKARLNDKFELEDFYKVIEIKVKNWKGTQFEKFLRPETLFGNKFEGYLNENNEADKKVETKSTNKKETNYDPTGNCFLSADDFKKYIENKGV